MGAVKNLKPVEALNSYLELLFSTETGFVYSATKSLDLEGKSDEDGLWTKHWFRWPEQRDTLVRHIETSKREYDVYIGVALYETPGKAEPEFIKGTFNFHVDFDGKVPTAAKLAELGIPHPTARICSSTEGHEHWYWRSPTFVTEIDVIQDINKTLVYALDGDIGGWSSAKVLRPVSAVNHKRNDEEVTIVALSQRRTPASAFDNIQRPRASFSADKFDASLVPNFLHVVAKYQITDLDFLDLLGKGKLPDKQKRSETLSRVGHHCIEHGFTDIETYSILRWKDSAWGKYRDREDGEKRLIELVNYCRGKQVLATGDDSEPEHDEEFMLKTHGYMSFIRNTDTTKYLIEGLLPETGLALFAGPSGVGKTLLTLDMARELVLGRSKFDWKSELGEQMRLLHISLEMPEGELKEFVEPAVPVSEEEQAILEKNFRIYAEPEIIRFYKRDSTEVIKLVRFIDYFKPHLITLDSATVGLAKDLLSSSEVQESLNFLSWLRSKFKCAMWIIAHTRKDPPRHGYKEKDLDDLFGVMNLAAAASAVIGIQKIEEDPKNSIQGEKPLDVNISCLKARFKSTSSTFQARLDPKNLSFTRPTLVTPYVPTQTTNTPPVTKKGDSDDFLPV